MDGRISGVRPAQQERSRRAWERALQAGREILETGGLDALTIAAVCARAGISPPSLYARVDGRGGLIAAVYDSIMESVRASEAEVLARDASQADTVEGRVRVVVQFVAEVFARHRGVLSAVITASVTDPFIHERGMIEAHRVQQVAADALDLPDTVARDIAAMVFSEALVHTVYGAGFSSPDDVDEEHFRERLVRIGVARAQAGGQAD